MGKSHIYVLNGIRGIAAIIVILSHSVLMFIQGVDTGVNVEKGWQTTLFNFPLTFFYKGNAAVSVFFVLSGVVLSLSCFRKNVNYDYLRNAALKRYIRLGIPAGVSIAICFALMNSGVFQAKNLGVMGVPLGAAYQFDTSFFGMLWDATFGAMFFGSVK